MTRQADVHAMRHPRTNTRTPWWGITLVVFLMPLLVVLALLWLVFFVICTICLHIVIWLWWCIRGRDILFVYSDSPLWHDYIQEHILPNLGDRAVVLNWSRRTQWRISLARMAFYHFGGWRAFNPMAVVFRPFRRTRTFRFLQPFRDFKHGRPETLRQMEREFFGLIGAQSHDTSA